jgi:hypothetical protein
MGMGNLADELDQLDDEYDYEEDAGDTTQLRTDGGPDDSIIEGARDSGIDVSYPPGSHNSPSRARNFSKPLGQEDKPPDAAGDEEGNEDRFSPDLEDLVATIARMTAYTTTSEDPIIPRTTALLHDLGPQSNLEAGIQRFNTATNSMTAYATAQTKSMQVLAQSLFSPLFFAYNSNAFDFDAALIEDTIPLIDTLLQDIPGGISNSVNLPGQTQSSSEPPSSSPSSQSLVISNLARLTRDTADVLAALSQLTDTLQMGKQITTTAARHLRTTQTMVAELLRERERAEVARVDLLAGGWNEKVQARVCGKECRSIVEGFRETCERLRSVEDDGVVAPVAVVS